MANFGFFGKYQPKSNYSSVGIVSGTNRDFITNFGCFTQFLGVPFYFEYDSSNSGSAPDQQSLLNISVITYNGDQRAIMATSHDTVSGGPLANFPQSNNDRRYRYLSNGALTKTFTIKLTNPEMVRSFSQRASTSNFGVATIQLPYLINGENVTFRDGTMITTINGAWPPKAKYIAITDSTVLNVVQRKFPSTLLGLCLTGTSTLGVIATVNALIADCVNLVHLLLTNVYTANDGALTRLPLQAGTLDISMMPSLKSLQLQGSTLLTNISFDASILPDNLVLRGLTALNATTFLNLLNTFLSSTTHVYFNCALSNRTITKTFINTDFKSTLTNFIIYGNIFTGTITLTTSRASVINFMLGLFTTSITTAASKNDFSAVDVSGLTAATTIDLSNSRIVTLTLPANTACTVLALGGNKLDVTVLTSLMAQIVAMTSLQSLYLSAGAITDVNIENGQNSTNGFGNNLDLSALVSLTTIQANNCKLTGTVKLPASIVTVSLDTNNITGFVAGTLTSISILIVSNNALFDFDFTRLSAITRIAAVSCNITTIDLSPKTGTATWATSAFSVNSNPNLTSITFPTTQARMLLNATSGSGPAIIFSLCPLLTTVVNIENINYNILTGNGQRIFTANGCALNTDLKIGINNWLPTQILLQNNAMSNTNVNLNIDNIYQNRAKWSTTILSKSINIAGTNAAPSGTYQAPTGFVLGSSDGTPASAKEQAYVLANNYSWIITTN